MHTNSASIATGLIDRRRLLGGGLALLGSAVLGAGKSEGLLDIHVHLFGIGEGGTGCRMAKSITNGLQFRFLVEVLHLRDHGKTLDEGYERVLVGQIKGSGLSRAAILGQDAVYDGRGKANWDRTAFYIPNDYVFAVVGRHPDIMIPCPSINPERGDAIDELNRCHDKGARLFKIHPPTQGVNVADRKHTKFFRRCAELEMVVMVHTGHEHSAPVIDKDLADPARLELALDQGCTVVACHAGSGWESDKPDQTAQLPGAAQALSEAPVGRHGGAGDPEPGSRFRPVAQGAAGQEPAAARQRFSLSRRTVGLCRHHRQGGRAPHRRRKQLA